MTSLFDASPQAAGFRLHRFEVLNWGTFDHTVQVLEPGGSNSLLTGANGSGKTTLVDALVTLLVPRPERFFNQSAGSDERKKQRTKEDYVIGAHGQSESDEGGKKREHLRDKSGQRAVYSVILGVFINDGLKQTYTLAQLRYFREGAMQEIFVLAPEALSIKTHFVITQTDTWRKTFRTTCPKAEFFPTFKAYSMAFARCFGLRCDASGDPQKALTLFAQTVGIKVMGNIDQFIRQNMLDEPDVEEEFDKLRHSFHELTTAHRSIRKARRQLELLTPLVKYKADYDRCEADLLRYDREGRLVAPWHAHEKRTLIQADLARKTQSLASAREQVHTQDATLARLREEHTELSVRIRSNSAGQQAETLKHQQKAAETARATKQKAAKQYAAEAKDLDLGLPSDSHSFDIQYNTLESRKKALPAETEAAQERVFEATTRRNALDARIRELETEIVSLEQRKNNLPAPLIAMRSRIAEALGIIDENELPFAGELLQVKEEERPMWGMALERLLHSFALCLLVPEQYYQKVNQYVRQTDLNGRLIYYRVKETQSLGDLNRPAPDSVRNKLEIKPRTLFRTWLEDEISRRFAHVCTSSEEDFARLPLALTPEGLIKNNERHEKDDRHSRRQEQVLGWDNRDKMRRLRNERKERETERNGVEKQLAALKKAQQELHATEESLIKLLQMKVFSDIDWQSEEKVVEDLKERIALLTAKNTQLKALEQRAEEVNKQILAENAVRDGAVKAVTGLESQVETLQTMALQLTDDLSPWGEELPDVTPLVPWLAKLPAPDSWQQMDLLKTKLNEQFAAQREMARLQQAQAERHLTQTLTHFRRPDQETLEQFPDWNSDTHTLPATDEPARDAREYLALHDRILLEGLPQHEERFEDMLRRDIFNQMTGFHTTLHSREKDIKNSIRDINGALKQIEFNPGTYLEIKHKPSRAVQVRDFRDSLNRWQFDTAEYHQASPSEQKRIMMETFEKIRQIISRLEEDEPWKKEVTDTRNWLEFQAQECFFADGKAKPGGLYEGSGGKSGGEQAKLTYTILSAAISYQFNIHVTGNNAKSFRFVVIDEAFSKLDSSNARYLMELAAQLHLQVMIITPLTAVQVAEPYIDAVFYVERKNTTPPRSHAYNLPIAVYQEQKERSFT